MKRPAKCRRRQTLAEALDQRFRTYVQYALYTLTEYESAILAAMPDDARVFDLERVRSALRKLEQSE